MTQAQQKVIECAKEWHDGVDISDAGWEERELYHSVEVLNAEPAAPALSQAEMEAEFDKWHVAKGTKQLAWDWHKIGWDAALATMQEPQGATCQMPEGQKHSRRFLADDPNHPLNASVCILCAKEAETAKLRERVFGLTEGENAVIADLKTQLSAAKERHRSDLRVIEDLQKMVEEKRERIRELELRYTNDGAALKNWSDAHTKAQAYIAKLEAQVKAMEAALIEVSKGCGPYSYDQYKFACDTIESMKAIAVNVLKAYNAAKGEVAAKEGK